MTTPTSTQPPAQRWQPERLFVKCVHCAKWMKMPFASNKAAARRRAYRRKWMRKRRREYARCPLNKLGGHPQNVPGAKCDRCGWKASMKTKRA